MRLTYRLRVATLTLPILGFFVEAGRADGPPQPNRAQVERLQAEGDRFADQGDYKSALEKYTEAAHGIVSKIRGQRFTERVLPTLMTREELGQEMLRLMQQEYSEDELLLMDSTYKAFGLIPRDMDSQKLMTALLTEEVAGFYDPNTKRMVLIQEEGSKKDPGWFGKLLGAKAAFDKDEQKTTLTHEMTHALQDQLYGLNAMEAGNKHDDDVLLAFSALVEGDATLLMFADLDSSEDITQSDPEQLRAMFNVMSWMLPLAGGKTYRSAPPIFRESMLFPYFQGMIFNVHLAGAGGWNAVHESYLRPPVSTEQILHPLKYSPGEHFDAPQVVTIPDLSDSVDKDWKRLGGNCLGELQTAIMLKSVAGGTRAAEGWDGDRYEIFRNSSGKLGLVSVSIWDSEADAQEFAIAYRKYRASPKHLSTRHTTLSQQVAEGEPDERRKDHGTLADEQAVFDSSAVSDVRVEGDQVWILEGFTPEVNSGIQSKLKECTFSEKVFQLPSR
jgi:hypothetical protein